MAGARREHRVVLVDDHVLFSESLELALSAEGYDVRRVGPEDFGSMKALATRIARHQPDLVLLDLDLGALGDSTPLIGPLARAGVNVLVVTGSQQAGSWGRCLSLGARAVLSKSAPLRDTVAAVRKLHQGQAVITVEEREALLGQWQREHARHAAATERFEKLTSREREVLGELVQGRAVREIAVLRHVSEQTVRTQVKSILAKLEVGSQLAAVGLVHEVGWRRPESDVSLSG